MIKPRISRLRSTILGAIAVPLAFTLTACSSPADAPPLAGAKIGGPFTLVNSEGKTVNWSDFDGKYRIVYFGFAFCPDICPTDLQRIMQAYSRFKEQEPELAAQVQPIFITTDPERDTPAVVGEFTNAFSKDLLGLTGTPEQIAAVVKSFGAVAQKGKVNPDGSYLVNHTRITYLMGRQGEPIAMLPVEEGAEAVAAELARWTS